MREPAPLRREATLLVTLTLPGHEHVTRNVTSVT